MAEISHDVELIRQAIYGIETRVPIVDAVLQVRDSHENVFPFMQELSNAMFDMPLHQPIYVGADPMSTWYTYEYANWRYDSIDDSKYRYKMVALQDYVYASRIDGLEDLVSSSNPYTAKKSYTIGAGTTHSSNSDRISGLNIAKDEEFFIYLKRTGDDSTMQVWCGGNDMSDAQTHYTGAIGTASKTLLKKITAKLAITNIGVYSSTRDSSSGDTVTFAVITKSSPAYSTLKQGLPNGVNAYTIGSGTAHSSSADSIKGLSISKNDKFFVYLKRTGNDSTMQIYGSDTVQYTGSIGTSTKTAIIPITAKNTITEIGVYSSTRDSSSGDTVIFAVITSSSPLYNIFVAASEKTIYRIVDTKAQDVTQLISGNRYRIKMVNPISRTIEHHGPRYKVVINRSN